MMRFCNVLPSSSVNISFTYISSRPILLKASHCIHSVAITKVSKKSNIEYFNGVRTYSNILGSNISIHSNSLPFNYDEFKCMKKKFCTNASAESYTTHAEMPRGGLPRFYSKNLFYSKGDHFIIDDAEYFHMIKSLRLKIGDEIEVFDGKGSLLKSKITNLSKNKVQVTAMDSPQFFAFPEPNWTVAVAFTNLKSGRADWLVEKCTELGAANLIPVLTQRSQIYSESKSDRWQRVALSAAKQCQRLHCLNIFEPQTLESLIPTIAKTQTFLAYAGNDPILKVISKIPKLENGILLIGPEGDFTAEEIASVQNAGAYAIGLGNNRLRVETAAVKILSIITSVQDYRNFNEIA